MIPRALPLLVLLLATTPGPGAVAATRFLRSMDDVPLAPGLTEDPGAAVVFSTPDGRIEEAAAAGNTTEAALRAYYRLALPPLGWSSSGEAAAMVFARGRDRLTLEVKPGKNGVLQLRIRLVTRAPSDALD